MRGRRRDEQQEFQSEVIEIRRVSKVVKGGKNLSFRVTVVVGDQKGRVGLGKGNTREIPPAIQQAIRDAKHNLAQVPVVNGTIPHTIIGEFKSGRVILKPAYPGTGIIAGETVGTICRLVGIRDILTKAMGSTNPLTLAKATIEGLRQLRTVEEVARLRDKDVKEVLHVETE
jgi:small subunit ribosomal protein S5